jgi:hypothetical protein
VVAPIAAGDGADVDSLPQDVIRGNGALAGAARRLSVHEGFDLYHAESISPGIFAEARRFRSGPAQHFVSIESEDLSGQTPEQWRRACPHATSPVGDGYADFGPGRKGCHSVPCFGQENMVTGAAAFSMTTT